MSTYTDDPNLSKKANREARKAHDDAEAAKLNANAQPSSAQPSSDANAETNSAQPSGGNAPHDPPVGTVLKHSYKKIGADDECTIVENGYSFDGTVYATPTAAAKACAVKRGQYSISLDGRKFWSLPAGTGKPRSASNSDGKPRTLTGSADKLKASKIKLIEQRAKHEASLAAIIATLATIDDAIKNAEIADRMAKMKDEIEARVRAEIEAAMKVEQPTA